MQRNWRSVHIIAGACCACVTSCSAGKRLRFREAVCLELFRVFRVERLAWANAGGVTVETESCISFCALADFKGVVKTFGCLHTQWLTTRMPRLNTQRSNELYSMKALHPIVGEGVYMWTTYAHITRRKKPKLSTINQT